VTEIWRSVFNNYVARQLRSPEDRLIAIAGVASTVKAYTCSDNIYMAGLWKNSFVEDLLWYRDRGLSFEDASQSQSLDIAPSWSWASVTGRLFWDESAVGTMHHTKLVGSSLGDDKFATSATGDYVVLGGPSLEAIMEPEGRIRPVTMISQDNNFEGTIFLDAPLEVVDNPHISGATVQRARSQQNND